MSCCFSGFDRQQGFTLLELLLAITIFAVVVSLVYGAYNVTFKVINNASSHAKYEDRARVALQRFVEDLESFHLGTNGFLEGETNSAGEYRADTLTFTSTAHLVFNKNELPVGYAVISYSVEENDETGLLGLYRSDIGFRPGASAEEDKGFLLCDGLREVAISYFDEDGDETETWVSEQQKSSGDTAVPAMVKLRIDFASEEAEDAVISFSTGVAIPRVR